VLGERLLRQHGVHGEQSRGNGHGRRGGGSDTTASSALFGKRHEESFLYAPIYHLSALGPARDTVQEGALVGLFLAFLLVRAVAAAPSDTLTGRWDSVTRSSDSAGTWMELEEDGTCTRTIGLSIDGTWTLEGDRLTVTTGPEDGRFVQTTTVSIAGLVLNQSADTIHTTRSRVSGPESGQPPLVGVWRYPHPAGGTAYDEYAADGQFLFRLPAETSRCQWTTDGDRLTLTEGGNVQTLSWHVEGDRLTLREGPQEESFRRERRHVIAPAAR
jgi:hypothetical protein